MAGYQKGNKSYRHRMRKFQFALTEALLTAATNGLKQTIKIGDLPLDAMVLFAPAVNLATQFTGGSASAVGLSVGNTASDTAYMTSFDIFGGTASGVYVRGAAGVAVAAGPLAAADVCNLVITPDGGHTLLALTAGACTVEVYWCIPDIGNSV